MDNFRQLSTDSKSIRNVISPYAALDHPLSA